MQITDSTFLNRSNPFLPKIFSAFIENYNFSKFQKDLIAGVIVGIVAIPLSIAFAIASGARPEQGLVTAVVAGFIASMSSGSMYQISGPTGAFVILVLSTITQYGYEGMLIATFLAGMMLVIAGFSRMGAVIKFIPYSVTVGFTSGIALLIATSQLADLFGISIHLSNKNMVEKWISIAQHIFEMNWTALTIGLFTIVIMRVWPLLKTPIPGSLIAIILSTVTVSAFSLSCMTIGDRYGTIEFSFPVFSFPSFKLDSILELIQPAIAIALLAGIESLLSAVVADGMTASRHRSHMELISQGFANIGSSLVGGLPATGAIARTATNIRSGAVSPVSGMIHAIVILASMLFLGTMISVIPLAALAGILLVIAYNMSEWKQFLTIFRCPAGDVVILLTTFLLTILVDLVVAIEVGIVLGAFITLNRFAEASGIKNYTDAIDQEENPKDQEILKSLNLPSSVEVYEIYGSLFFAAMEKFMAAQARLNTMPRILIIRMRYVMTIDASGIRLMMDLLNQAKRSGTLLLISGMKKSDSLYQSLEKAQFISKIGKENIFTSFVHAVDFAKERLDEGAKKINE
jgi:SulP family sulfate permease